MKRNILFAGLMLFSLSGFAQFVPNSSQAFQFISMYNPAFSGVDAYNDMRLGYRYQWAGLEDAPKSVNLSFNTRLRQPFDPGSNGLRLSNGGVGKIPNKKLTIHGLGINVFQLSYGVFETKGGGVNYAINYAFSKKLRFALGVAAVVEKANANMNKIRLRDPEELPGYSKTELQIKAGFLLYTPNFYFGFSYLPIRSYEQTPTTEEPLYTGSAQVGFSVSLSPTFLLKPSALAMLQTNNTVMIDYSLKAYIGSKVWGGLSYRDIQAGVGMLGFNINNTFTVSYSYEMSLGQFKQFNDGSHELILAVKLNNFKKQHPYSW